MSSEEEAQEVDFIDECIAEMESNLSEIETDPSGTRIYLENIKQSLFQLKKHRKDCIAIGKGIIGYESQD